ncbi:hypothetical protein SLEP1_g9547 [Rubroshorea leprosula]|uniref:Uncharacterized protein n=1 Tax=Rubroshorea leprosula TaxID=152421 RepID=A0AAV5IEH7_9ROSI|nr:hypothetical protein SLEP1_g9547 [Rubroshorea leprosula]
MTLVIMEGYPILVDPGPESPACFAVLLLPCTEQGSPATDAPPLEKR